MAAVPLKSESKAKPDRHNINKQARRTERLGLFRSTLRPTLRGLKRYRISFSPDERKKSFCQTTLRGTDAARHKIEKSSDIRA
ncbi:MAG: hypothetical protein DMF68_12500 [Acidobacteria bacterium]|nr:MAG: hypothetical protein DMF68_12500 [Acidobacteriota bacterium]